MSMKIFPSHFVYANSNNRIIQNVCAIFFVNRVRACNQIILTALRSTDRLRWFAAISKQIVHLRLQLRMQLEYIYIF